MTPGDAADFYMCGAGVLPTCLFFADEPALAIMTMVGLILVGCLYGAADAEAPFRTVERDKQPRRDATPDP